jgi:hypothetical protein
MAVDGIQQEFNMAQQQWQQQTPSTTSIQHYSPDYRTQRKYIEFHYFVFINYSSN